MQNSQPMLASQGINQPLLLGTSQGQQFVLAAPQQSMQGTSLLLPFQTAMGTSPQSLLNIQPQTVQGTIQGTGQQSVLKNAPGNQTVQTPAKDSNSANQNKKSAEKGVNSKPAMIFTLGTSKLPPEEQLKKFIHCKQAPVDQNYYVIANKGMKNEMTFFIEPKKAKKNKQPENQVKGWLDNICIYVW